MQSFEVSRYIKGVAAVRRVAERIRNGIYCDEADSYKDLVRYSSVPDDSASFYVDALHVRFIARLEYVWHVNNQGQFTSCQYAFFRQEGEKEVRVDVAVRFLAPCHVILPDLHVMDLPSDDEDGYFISKVRCGISHALLAQVVANLESWSY